MLAACTVGTHLATSDPARSHELAKAVTEAGAGQVWYQAIELSGGAPHVVVEGAGSDGSASPFPNGVAWVYLATGIQANSDTGRRVCQAVREAMLRAQPPILVTGIEVVGASNQYQC